MIFQKKFSVCSLLPPNQSHITRHCSIPRELLCGYCGFSSHSNKTKTQIKGNVLVDPHILMEFDENSGLRLSKTNLSLFCSEFEARNLFLLQICDL